MLGGAVGAGSPGGDGDLLTVTVVKDEQGYGMKVSGDNPVYVQSVKEHGAAWRAGLRSGDRILRVDAIPVHHHTHQQVVHMIRTNPSTVLTVQQNSSRQKTPITAPVPVNPEKQRQLEVSKVHTVRLMLEKEQKYIRDLRNELLKVPDVRKQAQLESAEQRCAILQHEIDTIMAGQPAETQLPSTPRLSARVKSNLDKAATGSPPPNTGFLSGLPRSLSNLTGQSLRNLRQARQSKLQQENQPPLVRQNSDDTESKRRHNHTVPIVPTTCLDNAPPPLPPRSVERPKRNPLAPAASPAPLNPLAKPKPSISPLHKQYYKGKPYPMHQSMPNYREDPKLRRSSHSLDGELDGPQPNSIALQMSYPLVNAPPPPLQTDNRTGVPVLHVRSQSSPEHLDHELVRGMSAPGGVMAAGAGERGTPPPGTPPPPYAHNTQPCADPQRAIISMEEDDSPASDNSTYSGLFSNLRSVRESKARTAVLLNWLLGERRCACASLLLVLTDAYRSAAGVTTATLRRWAYEIHSTFLMPNAVLQLNGVDEHMANEIDHVLVNEYDKEELLRNVFRKARLQAKEELARQLSEFQVKRQVGLGSLYGPDDAVLSRCDVDRTQEQVVVERLMCQQLSAVAGSPGGCGGAPSAEAHAALLAALAAAALCLHCRPASVAAAVGGSRTSFLQRDKLYKQRVKQITKQHSLPYVVRGHHLQVQALTSVAHCHHCELVVAGLAPQAYYCTDCKLRVHRHCARYVEESCCMDGEQTHNNRISRFMERIHHQPSGLDSSDKKSRKSSGTAHFLNMERSLRKAEDEQPWDQTLTPASVQESRREGSTDEPSAPDLDLDTSDNTSKELPEKEHSWRGAVSARGVNRAESCRERDAPRRGKHRNASDPNRLTAHHNHDLEPGAATAPSGSSSSSSLSSKSNESNTVATEQPSQTDWSEEEEPLAAQWVDSLPPQVVDSLLLTPRIRKRQEVIHELIVSEGSHVRWLKVLGKVFLHGLEGQSSLLPPDELKALFPNLPGVRERHARLYAELRAARTDAPNHIVQIRPIADAMLNTLGETGYASCLSRFCRGQRMALDCLRERRRKNKELHQFLTTREQLPLCGRLQLKDLLACVWQRLTKYQLLLEGILKTVNEDCTEAAEGESESPEDITQLKRALATAKEVLHSVDTAIRTAENEHRLRTIHSKLELRVPSGAGEWDELRRFELTQHALRMEGELAVRGDANKRTVLLALMLEEALVLLHREGDKFVLRPIGAQLSPLVKWDKVLFRPNAAVRNTFFLMNINGVQMHELSANTAAEYATWVKHIQEAPLARLTELKPSLTPSHQHTRSTDDSGINVSRNPSDASTKSSSSAPHYESPERDTPVEREVDANPPEREKENDREREIEKERENERDKDVDSDLDSRQRRATVGRISTHGADAPPALESLHAITVREPALQCVHTAHRAYSHQERLRRLDEAIGRALRAKSAVVAELLGVPADSYAQVAELAVAETLGHLGHDASGDRTRSENEAAPDIHQLLLAAQAQVSQLTAALSGALSVSEAAAVAARAGRCGSCSRPRRDNAEPSSPPADCQPMPTPTAAAGVAGEAGETGRPLAADWGAEGSLDMLEYDTLADISGHCDTAVEPPFDKEWSGSAARLAGRLVEVAGGLQAALGQLAAAVPALAAERAALRAELAATRERLDRTAAPSHRDDYQMTDEVSLPKGNVDHAVQDQQSNGG